MEPENNPPPIQQHQQPPPGPPQQVIAHPADHPAPYVPTEEERTMAMLIHLLGLLTGFIGALVLWLVKKDTSPFIDHHGKEAVNFLITNLILSIPMIFIAIVTLGLGLVAWMVFLYTFYIIACVQAYKGVWYRIPLNIRLIK